MSDIFIEKEPFGAVPETGEMTYKYTFVYQHDTTATASSSSSSSKTALVEKKKKPIASFISYGASLLNYYCPEKKKRADNAHHNKDDDDHAADSDGAYRLSDDVIVSYDTIEAFAAQPSGPFFGVTVGRYCNRIAKGTFTLEQPSAAVAASAHARHVTMNAVASALLTLPTTGTLTAAGAEKKENGRENEIENEQQEKQRRARRRCGEKEELVTYQLDQNNGPNHLHGGPMGFHHRNWGGVGGGTERADDDGVIIYSRDELIQHMDRHKYFALSSSERGPLQKGAKGSGSGGGGESHAAGAAPTPPSVTFPCLAFSLMSVDGDEGYPADVSIGVLYSVERFEVKPTVTASASIKASSQSPPSSSQDSAATTFVHRIRMDHMARILPNPLPKPNRENLGGDSDDDGDDAEGLSTVMNLTNHAYFNLSPIDAAATLAASGEPKSGSDASAAGGACATSASTSAVANSDTNTTTLHSSAANNRLETYIEKALPNNDRTQQQNEFSTEVTVSSAATAVAPAAPSSSPTPSLPLSPLVDVPITNHFLALNAPSYTPTDSTAIPTGKVVSVRDDPPMDFYHCCCNTDDGNTCDNATFFNMPPSSSILSPSSPDAQPQQGAAAAPVLHVPVGKRIGDGIDAMDASEQIKFGNGYDHNWCIGVTSEEVRGRAAHQHQHHSPYPYRLAAVLTDPLLSHRFLRVLTTQPGVQFYAGNFLEGTLRGKHGKRTAHRTGLCLETQHYPDSPNQPLFPSVILRPNMNYHHVTVLELGNM